MPFIAASYRLIASSRRIRRNDGARGSTVEDRHDQRAEGGRKARAACFFSSLPLKGRDGVCGGEAMTHAILLFASAARLLWDALAPTPPKLEASMTDPAALAEIEKRIQIVEDNLRQLQEQAAAYSGAADEERNAERIADQEAKLEALLKQREALIGKVQRDQKI
jgi:hypothetical protein